MVDRICLGEVIIIQGLKIKIMEFSYSLNSFINKGKLLWAVLAIGKLDNLSGLHGWQRIH